MPKPTYKRQNKKQKWLATKSRLDFFFLNIIENRNENDKTLKSAIRSNQRKYNKAKEFI